MVVAPEISSAQMASCMEIITNSLRSNELWAEYINQIYIIPLEFAVGTWLLHIFIGGALKYFYICFFGLFFVQLGIVYGMVNVTKKLTLENDTFSSVYCDSMLGIKIIKYFSWENPFISLIKKSANRYFCLLNLHTLWLSLLLGLFLSATGKIFRFSFTFI